MYFPCSFFLGGSINVNLIQKCSSNYVFDEETQECGKAKTADDLKCITQALELQNKLTSTTSTTTTTSTKSTTVRTTHKSSPKSKSSKLRKKSHKMSKQEMERLFPFGFYSDESELDDDDNDEDIKHTVGKKIKKNTKENGKKKYSSLVNRNSKIIKKSPIEVEYEELEYEEEYYDEDDELEQSSETTDSDAKSATTTTSNFKEDIIQDDEYKRMCVVTNWSQFRSGRGRFVFDFINVNLCNHIIYTSVKIEEVEDAEEEEYDLKAVQHNELGSINMFLSVLLFV